MTTTVTPRPWTGSPVPEPAADRPGTSHGVRTVWWRGRRGERLGLAALLAATAALYLVGLSRSGWANQFYAAAAQAGSKSWKAWLFGSLDPSNFITVDKPPASLWIMGLSVRLFGVNSWAVLGPQAFEGVAAVALLYAAVRRVLTPSAGLLAGAILATTPVAALMFRYDNPDALLVLLMTAAAYCTIRSLERARGRWLMLAGALLGLAFLTKMLQGLIVVPAFGLAYLIAAPTSLRRRIGHVLAALGALVVAAGWWVALVALWPAGSRPYIGGSTDDSILQLTFGYNGVGRLTGADNNGNVSGGTGGFSSGQTGLMRLFGTEMGSQISWLLPAALVGLVALGWLTARAPRTDRLRASAIVWGGWLLLTAVVFSFASGIIHPYYTVALAPAIAAIVALAVVALWRERAATAARSVLAVVIGSATLWTFVLLGRADWQPWLRWIVLLSGAGAIAAVLTARVRAVVAAPLIALTLLIAPTAYSVQTAATAHTGAIPTAGPSTTAFGGGGFGGGPGGTGGFGAPGGTGTGGTGTGNGFGRTGGAPAGLGRSGGAAGLGRTGGTGGPGGLGGAGTVSAALAKALAAGSYTWSAATTSDNEAATLELASNTSVMSLGGYNGTDPAISLAAFKALVAQGKVHYYIADGQGFIGSTAADTSTAYQIEQWVAKTFTATTIGGTTVYDLTG